MRIFVTGSTGVIGRRVVPLLVRAGHDVTATARDPEKARRLAQTRATPVVVDMFDVASLRPILDGQDAIINLATHMPSSSTRMLLPWAWRENDHVRRDGSAALVSAALASGVSRVVQESFAPIYEDGGDQWIDESWPVRPVSYNRTVLDAEHSAERFTASGRTGIVLRFAAFYGPDSRVLHDMIGLIRRGLAPIPGSPSAFLSSISHDDAATAVVAALDLPPGTYNVSDDEPLRRQEWIDSLAAANGLPRPKPLPGWMVRLGGSPMELLSRSVRMSNQKLRTLASWRPRLASVREGWRDRNLG